MLRGIWEFPNFLNSIKRNTTTPNKGARHFPTISSIPSSLSRSCIFIHPPLQGVKKFGNFSLDIGRKNMWLVVLPYPFCTFFGNHLSLSLSINLYMHYMAHSLWYHFSWVPPALPKSCPIQLQYILNACSIFCYVMTGSCVRKWS